MKLPDLSKFRPANHDLGIDLGTCNVLIYLANQGVVLREPSVVAVDKNTGKILQVGAAARNMLGRTPGNQVFEKREPFLRLAFRYLKMYLCKTQIGHITGDFSKMMCPIFLFKNLLWRC